MPFPFLCYRHHGGLVLRGARYLDRRQRVCELRVASLHRRCSSRRPPPTPGLRVYPWRAAMPNGAECGRAGLELPRLRQLVVGGLLPFLFSSPKPDTQPPSPHSTKTSCRPARTPPRPPPLAPKTPCHVDPCPSSPVFCPPHFPLPSTATARCPLFFYFGSPPLLLAFSQPFSDVT